MTNQQDIVIIDKQRQKAVVIDVAILNDGNIRKIEQEKLEKYQGLREKLENTWQVKASVVTGALLTMTSHSGEVAQKAHPACQFSRVWF